MNSNSTHPRRHSRHSCVYQDPFGEAVSECLDGILHYHIDHTSDRVTRYRTVRTKSPGGEKVPVQVYITSDPEVIEALTAAAQPFFKDKEELEGPVR